MLIELFCIQGQHYEEEKRALSHEIIALNNHLIEAKVTIDKLSEDNVSIFSTIIYRKVKVKIMA